MNIVFLGTPGTGKGAIGARCAKEHGFNQISPGDIFRQEVNKGTEIGIKVKVLLAKGMLVPLEITNALDKNAIKKNNIFDGYPRTLEQGNTLDTFLKIDAAILFQMSEDQIVERLAGRRVCPKCQSIYHLKNVKPKKEGICDKCKTPLIQRNDDKPDVIRNRFKIYNEQTSPLIEFYKKKGILKIIDASKDPDEEYEEVKGIIKVK